MSKTTIRRLIFIILLIISTVIFVWGIIPFGEIHLEIPISPSDMQLPSEGGVLPYLTSLL